MPDKNHKGIEPKDSWETGSTASTEAFSPPASPHSTTSTSRETEDERVTLLRKIMTLAAKLQTSFDTLDNLLANDRATLETKDLNAARKGFINAVVSSQTYKDNKMQLIASLQELAALDEDLEKRIEEIFGLDEKHHLHLPGTRTLFDVYKSLNPKMTYGGAEHLASAPTIELNTTRRLVIAVAQIAKETIPIYNKLPSPRNSKSGRSSP